jgi:hypothetical protein
MIYNAKMGTNNYIILLKYAPQEKILHSHHQLLIKCAIRNPWTIR